MLYKSIDPLAPVLTDCCEISNKPFSQDVERM